MLGGDGLIMRAVIGMGDVLFRLLLGNALVVAAGLAIGSPFLVSLGDGSFDRCANGRFRPIRLRRIVIAGVMLRAGFDMLFRMVRRRIMHMPAGVGPRPELGLDRLCQRRVKAAFVITVFREIGLDPVIFCAGLAMRSLGIGVLDDLALHALAAAAATVIAVSRAPAAAVVLALFLGFAMSALVGLDQRLTVRDRDLIIVRMDFAEGEKTVAVATVFNEGRLQRRLYARHLGEVDIAAQLLALGGLEVKFLDAIAADHDDPGLLRVGGIDQHFVRHFGALEGGGRVWP
jgi:hypothetical protein